jgi:anthranilate synthase component 1
MKNLCPKEFGKLAETYTVIPMVRERLADQETPISMARKVRQRGRFFLLESVEGGETWGRFSILGMDIRKEFIVNGDQAVLKTDTGETPMPGNPIDVLQAYLRDFNSVQIPGLPRFFGGAVGYFSFETVRFFERCGSVKPSDTPFPDAYFMIADQLVVYDNINHTLKLVCCVHPRDFDSVEAAYEHGCARLDAMEALVAQPIETSDPTPQDTDATVEMTSNMTRDAYEKMVDKAKTYIVDGDIIQVVLAQHFSVELDVDSFDVYRALRYINPSPYMYYLELDDDRAIAGSSPEVMVRVTDNLAAVRPIAGTRPRGADEAADQALMDDLLADPKELAEHVMLVDLARNDLGRIADIGSVHVREYMCVEKYSHVMHIVSHVDARIRPDCDAIDVFKATFPAGTLSGAPKVRAMEIINELEPAARGPYGGALGYITYGGNVMDMAITIRTVVKHGTTATVTAGAGIVYDSVPATEYDETMHKSRGMRRALELAARGLRIDGGME